MGSPGETQGGKQKDKIQQSRDLRHSCKRDVTPMITWWGGGGGGGGGWVVGGGGGGGGKSVDGVDGVGRFCLIHHI